MAKALGLRIRSVLAAVAAITPSLHNVLCEATSVAVVNTSLGELWGNRLQLVDEFLGIPFAESPEGELRFRKPVDYLRQYGPQGRLSKTYGPRCLQPPVDDRNISYSEDCLFLNVWVPRQRHGEALPVMVFVHGGGFAYGAGDMFNGSELSAATSSVVVTLNYRLGAFGFIDLSLNLDGANLGLLDQQAALRYVQREIKAFSGDASQVLLFGESAGAMSASLHIVMAQSAGLFRRVLLESGPPSASSTEYAQQVGDELARRLNCTVKASRMACLQARSADELLAVQTSMTTPIGNETGIDVPWNFFPSLDQTTLLGDPYELLESGHVIPGPLDVAAGVNRDEFSMEGFEEWHKRLPSQNFKDIVAHLLQMFHQHFGERYPSDAVADLLRVYLPHKAPNDLRPELGTLFSDLFFNCRTRDFLRLLAKQGHRTFKYVFAHRAKSDPAPRDWHVYHSSELPFIFGTSETGSMEVLPRMDGPEKQLLAQMRELWVSFASAGLPKTSSGQRWPLYNVSLDNHLILDTTLDGNLSVGEGFRGVYCAVWDSLWRETSQRGVVQDSNPILV
eukprot:TRINITY_DN35715_c0_g1_i1.p1 TRINITY_DN35715_c0_g1~~TRINITY_DN35715_c0_g1_i1.p1  ORF type:complete len:576 (-),score=75.92 TRINITY_DN35715_c0_g1_i1:38-1726(-)